MPEGRTEFAALAGRCELWQATARQFVVAANYLVDWYDPPDEPGDPADLSFGHGGSNAPMMVLFATAVENLMKAVRVAMYGAPPLQTDGKIASDFATHNLRHHAAKIGLDLTDDEQALLEHLRQLLEAGRYPVARIPGEQLDALQFDYPRDVERVWALLDRLESVLRHTGKPCLPAFDVRARLRPPGYDIGRD